MIKISLILLVLAVVCLGLAQASYADDDDALDKLGRGLTNIFTGWLDIFFEVAEQTHESGHIAGAIVGPVKGIFKAAGRTAVGFYETATWPVPSYKPVVEPEFVWQRVD